MTEKDPLRLGILGAGAISQVVHLPIFAEREDVDLVALGDQDIHKAETLSQRFSIPLVMEAGELLELDELDAVVICTPNHLHEEMAIRALEAGKHVLVERPLAATADGASRVIEAAVRAGQVLAVGMPHRFRPEVIGKPPRQREQIVLWYVQDAGELPNQMPGAGTTPIMLDVVQVLRRDRPSVLLLHDASGELLLAQPEPLAGL